MIDGLFKMVRKAALYSKLTEDYVRLQQEYLQTPNSEAKRARMSAELFMRKQHLKRIEASVLMEIHEPGNNYKTPIPV